MSSNIDWNNIETTCKEMEEVFKIIKMDNKKYDSLMKKIKDEIINEICSILNLDKYEVSIMYAKGKIYVQARVGDINSNLTKNIESLGFEWRLLDTQVYETIPNTYHIEITKQILNIGDKND